ncbi:MAG: undecaprenyl-phosphate 4-deoxy-4-formamido-L-arabinose transferase [Nitrospirae bacterium]|nr:MAG: undecaprenyl-phosphate 4-deoxy-4-formamido-L-arabinose transferase [Nitrospirota bacterium]
MTVTVVIPLLNEEDNVIILYERLHASLVKLGMQYEIIFVDDGSTDQTLPLLEDIQKKDCTVVVLSLRRNFGQTAAFAAGFDFARGDVVITMDGDLQNDPDDIGKMVEAIQDVDLVSGWRKNRQDAFLSRKLPSKIANWLISRVTGVRLHDYGCSLKAYRRDVVKNLRLYGEMHRFIPAVASWYGVRIKEIETVHHPRLHGKSKYGIGRTVKVLLDLITVKFLQSFSTKPIQFFGPIGVLLGVLGTVICAYLAIEKLFFGVSIGGRPLLMLGGLLIIVGVQFIGLGLLGEMIVRVYHESQKKPIYTLKKILGPGA